MCLESGMHNSSDVFHFTNEPLSTILDWAREQLKLQSNITFDVINPDIKTGMYAGETVLIDSQRFLYRSYRAWNDFAEILGCRMMTPLLIEKHIVRLRFERLSQELSFHQNAVSTEKYGTDSIFSRIHKNEEPSFYESYKRSLNNARIEKRLRILNLGINTGDEFEMIHTLLEHDRFMEIELVGIDHSHSAIEKAKERFTTPNVTFYTHDINELSSLDLGRFDLIISIGTLQSSTVDFKLLFASLVQNYLEPHGALVLGFPNCRWIDGEMVYGAKVPHYNFSEMSLVIKDLHYCKKYLQQKKFRVSVTGKHYLFLTATKIS